MNIKKAVSAVMVLTFLLFFPLTAEAWFAMDHPVLASQGEQCISLPRPPQKRCALPVDELVLKSLLGIGSMEPDIKDESSSPKHALNPMYDANKRIWDPAIRATLGMPNAQIIAGTAIETIGTEINNTKSLLGGLKCDSGLPQYGMCQAK